MHYDLIKIKTAESATPGDGCLSVFEGKKDIPFSVERFFYIHGVAAGTVRGGHAHKKTEQLLFCVQGEIEILLDDGREKMSILLDDPKVGLVVYPEIWHNMIWKTDGAILCVAASAAYDPQDYLREYQGFLEYYHIDQAGTAAD